MCMCDPEVKAPFCGKPGCQPPEQVPFEPLYALLLPDGQWGQIHTRGSHGPNTEMCRPVANINQATVMQRYRWRKWEKEGILVPAKETRIVTVIPGNFSRSEND